VKEKEGEMKDGITAWPGGCALGGGDYVDLSGARNARESGPAAGAGHISFDSCFRALFAPALAWRRKPDLRGCESFINAAAARSNLAPGFAAGGIARDAPDGAGEPSSGSAAHYAVYWRNYTTRRSGCTERRFTKDEAEKWAREVNDAMAVPAQTHWAGLAPEHIAALGIPVE
jgi:hypothetical protein